MAFPAYFSAIGSRQRQFKGEAIEAQRRDKWMTVLGFYMDLESPHDPTTGLATGKREWKPLKVVKQWGAASPEGLTACATNEILTQVIFEFTKTNRTGEEYVYQSITLIDAVITEIARFTGRPGAAADATVRRATPWADMLELEEWSLTFRKIEVVDKDGNTTFADDWVTGI